MSGTDTDTWELVDSDSDAGGLDPSQNYGCDNTPLHHPDAVFVAWALPSGVDSAHVVVAGDTLEWNIPKDANGIYTFKATLDDAPSAAMKVTMTPLMSR